MPGEVRTILDDLPVRSLRRLCRARGLGTGGGASDNRSRLARSFRGDLGQFIPLLRRKEMIWSLEGWIFSMDDGREGELCGLNGASKAELRRVMKRVFADDWEPSDRTPQPFGAGFRIFIDWIEPEENEEGGGGGVGCLEVGENLTVAQDGRTADLGNVGVENTGDVEATFVAWLRGRMGSRGTANLLIKTLVNRLGRYHAAQRLSTPAVRDIGQVLARGGFTAEPDLAQVDRSPGVDARVRISARPLARESTPDWRAVPDPPAVPPGNPLPARSQGAPPILSGFEKSAAKLKFLVTVAGSVQRLGEAERRTAVERVVSGASLGAADHARLRAMAHQYSSGQGELNPAVQQLRVTLSEAERRDLLAALRDLAPATAEFEALIALYGAEFGVDVPCCAAAPDAQPSAVQPATDQPREPVTPSAGGVRENSALDGLLGRGGA